MLGEHLLRRARELGLSKTDLCKRAGISRETLYRLLRNDLGQISFETLLGLSSALQVAPLHLARLAYHEIGTAPPTLLPTAHAGDHVSFVRDVTYSDNDVVPAGQEFVKTWEIHNTGRVRWRGRAYRCQDDDLVLARRAPDGTLTPVVDANLTPLVREVECPDTPPGAVIQISVKFRAPLLPCMAMSLWKMVDSDGALCFPQFSGLWCKVRVMSL